MMNDGTFSGGVFFAVVSKPRGIFSFGCTSNRRIEETIDILYRRYSAELCNDLESPISMPPEQAQQAQVQKYLVPSGGFGLTVQPGFEAITEELIRVHPLVHFENDTVVCFKGCLSNAGELRQRLLLNDRVERRNLLDATSLTSTLMMELYRKCGASDKLLLSELQGQYAFVLYDGERKATLVARDPSGAEELYWKHQEDGSVALTNSLDHLPAGEDPQAWQEFPPGHFMTGRASSLQQFALTREQLISRERQESLESDYVYEEWNSVLGSPKQKSEKNFLARLSRKSRPSISVQ